MFEDGDGDDVEVVEGGDESDGSDEDIQYMGQRDSRPTNSGERRTLAKAFNAWPKGDEAHAIFRLLNSRESEKLWTDWLSKYPVGDIDPADVLNLVLPHALLRDLLGDYFPLEPIHNGYREFLSVIREKAIAMFERQTNSTFRRHIGSLRSALAALGTESPTYRKPACGVCVQNRIPCMSEDDKRPCRYCSLHRTQRCGEERAAKRRGNRITLEAEKRGDREKKRAYMYSRGHARPRSTAKQVRRT